MSSRAQKPAVGEWCCGGWCAPADAAVVVPGMGRFVVRFPPLPESSVQNGSPTVIVGPKLPLLLPVKANSLSLFAAIWLPSLVHPVWAPTSGTSTLECIHWARNGGGDVPSNSQCSKQLMDAEQSSLNAAPGRLLKPYPPAGDPS